MQRQRTIKNEVSFSGKGFMLNELTEVTLRPAVENAGICFIRDDLEGSPVIEALPQNLRLSPNCTTLQKGDAKVIVVEHLMATLWAFGVTNLEVRLSGAEIPTFDGSAKPFCDFIRQAGIVEQDSPIKEIELITPIVVREDREKFLMAIPAENFALGYVLKYDETPELGTDFLMLDGDWEKFIEEVLPARTFIPEQEARRLLEQGIISSTDESMGVVVRPGDKPQLRVPQEFTRHKILDMAGDLFVLGKKVKAHFLGVMSGHRLNARMVRAIAARYP